MGPDGRASLKISADMYTIALAKAPTGMFATAMPPVPVVAGNRVVVGLMLESRSLDHMLGYLPYRFGIKGP